MEKKKTTGDLLDIIKKGASFSEAQKKIGNEQLNGTLSQHLNELVAQRGAVLADIMKRSGLKKAYFYSLFDGSRDNPSRDVLIQLGFGFEMTLDEMQEFLKRHGAAQLYPRIPRDGVIIYALHRKMTVVECDILLADNEEALLSRI